MNRRIFIGLAVAFGLAACTAPLLDDSVAADLKVNNVTLDLSQLEKVTGREITVSKAKIEADVSAALTREFRAASVGGTRLVNVKLKLNKVALVSPGQALLLGGVSSIRGTLEVHDAATGEVVLAPTEVYGNADGYAPGGLIAVALSKTPQKDYEATVAGFAADVRKSLFKD